MRLVATNSNGRSYRFATTGRWLDHSRVKLFVPLTPRLTEESLSGQLRVETLHVTLAFFLLIGFFGPFSFSRCRHPHFNLGRSIVPPFNSPSAFPGFAAQPPPRQASPLPDTRFACEVLPCDRKKRGALALLLLSSLRVDGSDCAAGLHRSRPFCNRASLRWQTKITKKDL